MALKCLQVNFFEPKVIESVEKTHRYTWSMIIWPKITIFKRFLSTLGYKGKYTILAHMAKISQKVQNFQFRTDFFTIFWGPQRRRTRLKIEIWGIETMFFRFSEPWTGVDSTILTKKAVLSAQEAIFDKKVIFEQILTIFMRRA